jgi:hypothetical protein
VNFLADFLAKLALGVLQVWLARSDIQTGERQRLVLESLGLENEALAWLAEARLDPDRWARLRVLPGAAAFESFRVNAKSSRKPDVGNVPTGKQ